MLPLCSSLDFLFFIKNVHCVNCFLFTNSWFYCMQYALLSYLLQNIQCYVTLHQHNILLLIVLIVILITYVRGDAEALKVPVCLWH